MTTQKLAVKKLLVSGFAAVALSLSTGAFASVSATNGDGHNNGNGSSHNNGNNGGGTTTPSVGGVKLGVQQRTNVGTNHGATTNNNGNGQNGGSGYGGTNVDVDNNVWVQIGNVVGGAVNITINFVNNIFS